MAIGHRVCKSRLLNPERPLKIRIFTLSLASVCGRCRLCPDEDDRHPWATPWRHVSRCRHANPTDFELITNQNFDLRNTSQFCNFLHVNSRKSLIKNENKAKKKFFLTYSDFSICFNRLVANSLSYIFMRFKMFQGFVGESSPTWRFETFQIWERWQMIKKMFDFSICFSSVLAVLIVISNKIHFQFEESKIYSLMWLMSRMILKAFFVCYLRKD